MKTDLRRFAPYGLYLALAAAIVAAGLYIVQQEFNLYLQISLGLIVIGLALYAALDPEQVRIALTGRQARYGSNALVMTLAFVGILVVINYLVYQYPKRWDMTEDAEHTLVAETIQTLQTLPDQVEALAFYPPQVNSEQARKLLENYKFYGDEKFDYRFIDPISDPVTARQVNVPLETNGTIVLVMGSRQEKVTYPSEQEMTGGLVRLMSEQVSVYFLTGHGEYSPDEVGEQSYSELKRVLGSKNYEVNMLNLLATPTIPVDAGVIVIAGPRKPVTQQEVDLLDTYLAQGGGLIIMQEPLLFTDYGDAPDPLADYLAAKWGVVLRNDMVVDLSSNQPFLAFSGSYNTQHIITSKMQSMITAFPTVRSVSADVSVQDVSLQELVFTSPQSWAETNLELIETSQQAAPDDGQDLLGPVPLAVASESMASGARVVVFGDADFAIDANFAYLGNGDILVNAIDWVSEQENLINLTPRTPRQRILLQPATVTKGVILLGSVFVPAGLVVFGGIWTFIQRRRRG